MRRVVVPPEFLLLGTFLPFVALQHHGSYGGYRRHVGDGAARPSLTHLCHLMIILL